jgi:hypothetical protein
VVSGIHFSTWISCQANLSGKHLTRICGSSLHSYQDFTTYSDVGLWVYYFVMRYKVFQGLIPAVLWMVADDRLIIRPSFVSKHIGDNGAIPSGEAGWSLRRSDLTKTANPRPRKSGLRTGTSRSSL